MLRFIYIYVCMSMALSYWEKMTDGIGAFPESRGTYCEDIRRVKFGVHSIRLTGIDHEEYFVIPETGHQKAKNKIKQDPWRIANQKKKTYRFF